MIGVLTLFIAPVLLSAAVLYAITFFAFGRSRVLAIAAALLGVFGGVIFSIASIMANSHFGGGSLHEGKMLFLFGLPLVTALLMGWMTKKKMAQPDWVTALAADGTAVVTFVLATLSIPFIF